MRGYGRSAKELMVFELIAAKPGWVFGARSPPRLAVTVFPESHKNGDAQRPDCEERDEILEVAGIRFQS